MNRKLLRGATIITMDNRIGDFDGDILVDGNTIVAVGKNLNVEQASVIDVSGRIIIPGMINAHMHTWQTSLRGLAANWILNEHDSWFASGLAACFDPEDVYISALVGAVDQINCGVTTLVDWCDINVSRKHTDAAVRGLVDAGIRAVFLHGSARVNAEPGQTHFSEVPQSRAEVRRLLDGPFRSGNQLVTLGLALLGPRSSTLKVARHDLQLAREFGLIASVHQGGGSERAPDGWESFDRENLIGPWINIVHGSDLTDLRLSRLVDLGVTFTISPESETTQGQAFPIVERLRRLGAMPSVGVDLESIASGDLLAAARLTLSLQRAKVTAGDYREIEGNLKGATATTREALSWVTVAGARSLRMEDSIGSLAPGKRADLVVLDPRAIKCQPALDPVSTVVMHMSAANIEAVMIAGRWKKRGRRLLATELPILMERLRGSGRSIARRLSQSVDLKEASA